MPIYDETIWAGSEASHAAALKAEDTRLEHIATAITAGTLMGKKSEAKLPRIMEQHEDVAILNIKGSLNNDSDEWWNSIIGAVGYPEIRDALVHAAQDPGIKHILLDIDSGGGSVSGLADTGSLVRMIHDKVKPVTAFASGNMYSAAYWLGSSAGDVHASKGSGVGSIGVIAVHMERSKMMAEAGIGVNVIRAGKYKALANPYEKLTPEGEAQIQAGVDAANTIFLEHVADMRGKSVEHVDKNMAQGREFYGQAAADVGLIDSVTTFDALMSSVKEKLMDTSANSMHNRGKQPSGMRTESNGADMKTLSDQDIAALATGVNLEATVASESPADETEVQASVGTETETQATETTAEVDTSVSALTVVMGQLKAAQDDLITARLELGKAQDKIAGLEAVVNPLKDIAARALNNMRVAMSGSVMDMSAVSATQILAEHTTVAAAFAKKFPVGGVASTDAESSVVKNERKVDALSQARLNAVRFSK